jgi:hypothetical protein
MLRERAAWAWREVTAWSWVQWAIAGVATITVGAFARAILENGYSAWVWGPLGIALVGLVLCMVAIARNEDAITKRRKARSRADFLMLEIVDIRRGLSALGARAEFAFGTPDTMYRWIQEIESCTNRAKRIADLDGCPIEVRAALSFPVAAKYGAANEQGPSIDGWLDMVNREIDLLDSAVAMLSRRYGLHPPPVK